MKINLKDKKILFVLQRDWAIKHGFEIVKKLQANGAQISLVLFKKSTENYVDAQKNIKFNYILRESEIERNAKEILKNFENYDENQLLDDFNIKSFWQFAHTLRGKATSYKSKFPFSYEQNLNDNELKSYILAFGKSIIDLYSKFKPELLIFYNYGDLRHHLLAQRANVEKIPFIFMNDTKVKNISAFFYDLNCEKSFFQKKIEELNKNFINSKFYQDAIKYIEENRIKIQTPVNIINTKLESNFFDLEEERNLVKKIYRKLKNKNVNLDDSEKVSFYKICKNYIISKKNIFDLKNFSYDKLENLRNFVFLPLQHEPEAMLGMCNSTFDNQLETAKILARNLPKNYCLVVKNHPYKYFFRSKKYLNKFKNTPNIKVIDHKIPNELIYKKMKCLISFSGTSIFEAAIIKKPAIQIGNLKSMKYLPNIFFLKNLEEVNEILENINNNFEKIKNSDEYDNKLIRYIAAAYETGFYFDKYEDDLRTNKESLEYIWSKYIEEMKKIFDL